MTDRDIEKRLKALESSVKVIQAIKQLPSDSTLNDVILTVNRITNNLKR